MGKASEVEKDTRFAVSEIWPCKVSRKIHT